MAGCGTSYLIGSASRDIVLPTSVQAGERVELEYDLFIEDPVDAYAETSCTLQLFGANGGRTRLLLGLAGTATIQATFDPADSTLESLTKSVIATRVAGDYRVKTTFAATAPTAPTTANVHYAVRDGAADFTGDSARMGRRPRRPTLQLGTSDRRSPSSGKHRWTASES